MVSAGLDGDPQLLVVNKFGKHEADGRGFRPVIGEALSRGIPVLAGVNGMNEAAFVEFTEGLGQRLDGTPEALEAWFSGIEQAAAK